MLPSAVHLLPTPEASDGSGGRKSSQVGGVRPSGAKRAITLATRVGALLPTPKTINRASRSAMTQRHWASPQLEQAIEIAQGILPREFATWDEVPGWSGGSTSPRSDDGSESSDDPPQLPLS